MRGWVRIQAFATIARVACLAVAMSTATVAPALASEEPDASGGEATRPGNEGEEPTGYDQVLIVPLVIGYTEGFLSKEDQKRRRIQGADILHMQRHYQEVVSDKLADAYPLAAEPGPGVVHLEAFLIDHTIDKRDWFRPTLIVFRAAPKVRLVAFLRDSETGALVDSVGFSLRPHANRMMKESPGFYWDFMRKVFDRMATRMRWRLEDGARTVSE